MAGKAERGRKERKRRGKPVLVIAAEGRNTTESSYFAALLKDFSGYACKFLRSGHVTDPRGLLKAVLTYWKQNELSESRGDKAFIVLDLDCDEEKEKILRELSLKSRPIRFVISNPCFEVWFLMHFEYSAHEFQNSAQVIQALRRYIVHYEKNLDVAAVLLPRTSAAMRNADRLRAYHAACGYRWPSVRCNPGTDIPAMLRNIGAAE